MNTSAVRSSRQVQLRGPRPTPLMVSKNSTKITKKSSRESRGGPVIVYLKSPEVIHVRPEEFMSLVQKLTGKPREVCADGRSGGGDDGVREKGLVKRNEVVEFGGYGVPELKVHGDNDVSLQSAFSSFCLNVYTDW